MAKIAELQALLVICVSDCGRSADGERSERAQHMMCRRKSHRMISTPCTLAYLARDLPAAASPARADLCGQADSARHFRHD